MRKAVWWGMPVLIVLLAVGCARESERLARESERPAAERAEQPAKEDTKTGNASAPQNTTGTETQKAPARKQEETPAPELKVVAQKVTLAWQEGGKPKLAATASELVGNTVSGKAAMKQVSADLYDSGKLVAKLSAPLVEADEKTRVITARGGVTVTSTLPESTIRTIKADWIKWYSRQDKLIGNGGVSARGPVASIDAAAFTADTRLRTVKVMADPVEARAVIGEQ